MTLPLHILTIEDDPAIARSLQDALSREGYQVTWKDTGAAGIEFVRTEPPQLVLLDVRLPDGSGFDVCRKLRQMGFKAPVILLTVQHEEMDKVLGLEMGADDYLTKPFGLRELQARVRAQIRRAYGEYAASDANQLYAGDLVIDLSRGQVRRGNLVIELTPTEFRLLAYMAQHAGLALSRSQIIEAVWGFTPEGENEQMVNVHVRRLREKIEPDPARPSLLLTVPGIGYRLDRSLPG